MTSRGTYDVITSEPMPPVRRDDHFYTREYYARRKRLARRSWPSGFLSFDESNGRTDGGRDLPRCLSPRGPVDVATNGDSHRRHPPLETDTTMISRRIAARGWKDLRRTLFGCGGPAHGPNPRRRWAPALRPTRRSSRTIGPPRLPATLRSMSTGAGVRAGGLSAARGR